MRTLTITAAEWASITDGTLWLVRDGFMTWEPPAASQHHPPVEFAEACAPCDRCEEGCDITMCLDCGEDYTEPCAHHLAAGHHVSTDPYGDMVDCHACCRSCRIELVVPCPQVKGCPAGMAPLSCGQCHQIVQVGGTVTLGHAYAVGPPLPIYTPASHPIGTVDHLCFDRTLVVVVNVHEGVETDITDRLAHYGPPELLVGKWALQLAVQP